MSTNLFPRLSILLFGLFYFSYINAQDNYRYAVDLTKADDDRLAVELITPTITKKNIVFYFPKIVPGTYMNSNYGKYVHNLKAYTRTGSELPVKHTGDNSWEIKNADKVNRITYKVEDTWDSEIKNKVYTMCGTNFEAGKNFVVNTPGLFGYFDGMKKNPFDLIFTKPQGFYAATGLKPVSSTATSDLFRAGNADELYDSPIMFSLPDTTTIRVGNADVLIAVYSPKKLVTSKFIATHLEKLLMATKDYLKGKLPVDKYAFIYYFNGEQKPLSSAGAWEHSYSSFYSVPELPQEEGIGMWVDISSHEFFHIVTPLTISSKEVKEFNFNETVLSKHLWLYEGSTEYYAHHVQVWGGLITPEKFLETMAQKISYSRSHYNDSLSFTEMSKESAGRYADQYNNVYQKGALISACLDLYLLHLSGNQYGLRDLKHDLGVKYGKDKYFEDEQLFDEIEKLTYPEIKEFLLKHVQGGEPTPYEKYFGLAGVKYIPTEMSRSISLGGIGLTADSLGRIVVNDVKAMDDFGKKMGYQLNDEVVSLNGETLTLGNAGNLIQKFFSNTKEGDPVKIEVRRNTANGQPQLVTLTATALMVDKPKLHQLKFDEQATPEQLKLRGAWMSGSPKKGF
ncbi:M61 family metallopeptidase [Terrimonas alba]|uniref:M61 family metallopeptidase n=1 Tax=Terrimonas alba TaxID=3349636 RepID=UPI0035F3D9A2